MTAPPRLGSVPHFRFSPQALNHLTQGPIREAPLTDMLRCQAAAQEAAGRSQNYVNRAGDRAKAGATITPNIPISAFFSGGLPMSLALGAVSLKSGELTQKRSIKYERWEKPDIVDFITRGSCEHQLSHISLREIAPHPLAPPHTHTSLDYDFITALSAVGSHTQHFSPTAAVCLLSFIPDFILGHSLP